jgi:hypothetical protein
MCSSPSHALKSGLESKSGLENYNTVTQTTFQVISELGKGLALVVKYKSISGLKLLYISLTALDFYLKFVPDIHFPVEDTDTKFQRVSQKNQGVTSD